MSNVQRIHNRVCQECGEPGNNTICAIIKHKGSASFYCSTECLEDNCSSYAKSAFHFDLDSATLEITPYDSDLTVLNLDGILAAAAEFMPNLLAVDIFVPQEYALSFGRVYGSDSDDTDDSDDDQSKNLILTAHGIRNFFGKVHNALKSFSFRLDDCCWDIVKTMTDGGKAFLPLGTMPNLKKLTLSLVGFDDIHVLMRCLYPNLKVLKLSYVKMRSNSWCIEDVNIMISTLRLMNGLITLDLSDNALTDNDLEDLLPQLKEMRCLNLSGKFGRHFETRNSLLTDQGLEAVAKYCPKLRSLDVSHQPKVTSCGIRGVLQKCSDLLELEATDIKIAPHDLTGLFNLSDKLLHFRYDPNVGGVHSHEQYLVYDAMVATGGRTVVGRFYKGVYEILLKGANQKRRKASMKVIEEAHKRRSDPDIFNIWDAMPMSQLYQLMSE
jgi:hypothetical protein